MDMVMRQYIDTCTWLLGFSKFYLFEDECHFLFKCQKLSLQRIHLMDIICKSCPNFITLNSTNELIWALSCEHVDVLLAISEFIKLCE